MSYQHRPDADERAEPLWQEVARIGRRQGRAVSLAQLKRAGLSRDEISNARLKGHIHRYHRGVYALGTAELDLRGRLWAAHLAVGPDSVLALHTAGQKWAIRPWAGDVHVFAPKRHRAHRGVVVHEVRLPRAQIRRRDGLPFTTPARTLLDLAAVLEADALAMAVNQALAINAIRLRHLDAVLQASPGHHGSGALARALAAQRDDPGAGRTRGEMEALFLTLLRKLGPVPPFVRNATLRIADDLVVSPDALFVAERVWIELDSRSWHEQRLTMDADRRKDRRGTAAGYAPFRITWRHLVHEWSEVSADLLEALERRGSARMSA